MDKFITVISNSEFWLALVCGAIISFILATIIQDVIDMYRGISKTEYRLTNEEPYIGCMVYDTFYRITGVYCGNHSKGNACGVIIVMRNNTVYYYYSSLKNLKTVK